MIKLGMHDINSVGVRPVPLRKPYKWGDGADILAPKPGLTRKDQMVIEMVTRSTGEPGWINEITWADVVLVPEPAPLTADQMKAKLAAKRYEVETGGIVVGEVSIRTDRESQSLITGAQVLVTLDSERIILWKAETSWVSLDAGAVTAIAVAVADHVQACFAREAELSALIDAAADPSTVDINTGWSGEQ